MLETSTPSSSLVRQRERERGGHFTIRGCCVVAMVTHISAITDELTAMKKNLSATEEQRDIFRGEMMKYKQILVKKDKEIEDLIMSGHVSTRDRARINTGNKADVLLVRSSN